MSEMPLICEEISGSKRRFSWAREQRLEKTMTLSGVS